MVWLDEGGRGSAYARLIPPPASLAPWVEHLWIEREHCPAPEQQWRIVADFCGHLVFAVDSRPGGATARCSMVGSRAVYGDISVARRRLTIGARLRIGALAELTRTRADLFTGRAFPVEDIFGFTGRELIDRLSHAAPDRAVVYLQEFLERELSNRNPDLQWQTALRSVRSVASLAGALNLSPRAAYARTLEIAGLSPRRLLRIMRLHRALHFSAMERRRWPEIAYLAGFADQAHMVREFRALLGDSPNSWRRRSIADSFNTTAPSAR